MKTISFLALFAVGALSGSMLLAQNATTPPERPANATGLCRDGTYTTDAGRSIACKKHHGVKEWFTPASAPVAPPAAENAPQTPPSAGSQQPYVPQSAPSKTTQVRTQSLAAAKAAGDAAETAPLATRSIASASPQSEPATPPATSSRHGARKTPAPGGGPGLVWLNPASNVYHCPGTPYYGTTRKGSYMSETDAKAKGARIARGESCGQ